MGKIELHREIQIRKRTLLPEILQPDAHPRSASIVDNDDLIIRIIRVRIDRTDTLSQHVRIIFGWNDDTDQRMIGKFVHRIRDPCLGVLHHFSCQAASLKCTLADRIIRLSHTDKIRPVHESVLDLFPAAPLFICVKQYFLDMAGALAMLRRLEHKIIDVLAVIPVAKPLHPEIRLPADRKDIAKIQK